MDNQFTFEFNQILKNQPQTKPIRILLEIIISFGLVTLGEYSFYSSFDKMTVVSCSNENNNSTMSLDNCFDPNNQLTTCINQQFNTGSNYSLAFTVPLLGIDSDKYSKPMIGIAVILFLSVVLVYHIAYYFQIQKRKRIQEILSQCLIYIDGNKKVTEYGKIECQGINFKLLFQDTLSSYIGNLIVSSLFFIFLPLIYFGSWRNYLSNLDLKQLTLYLSNNSIDQIKELLVITPEKYNEIIDDAIDQKYSNQYSFINLFFRKNTFSFTMTKTSEIVNILQIYKKEFPNNFESMLYNETKLKLNNVITPAT